MLSFSKFLGRSNFFQDFLKGKDMTDFPRKEFDILDRLQRWHLGNTRDHDLIKTLVGMRKKYPNELMLPKKYKTLYRVTSEEYVVDGVYTPRRNYESFTTSLVKAKAFVKDSPKKQRTIIEVSSINHNDFVINPDFFDAFVDRIGSFFVTDTPESETLYIKKTPLKVNKISLKSS